MLIGAMNHPRKDVIEEMKWMAATRLDFIDLSLEPPAAAAWRIDARELGRAAADLGLKVVGHTAYYLPLGSPFDELRRAAVSEFARCLEAFAIVGARWMNVHPDRYAPMHDRSFYIHRNLQSLNELLPLAKRAGVGLMIENIPGDYNTPEQLGELLDPLPEVALHLDIGHCNLLTTHNTCDAIVERYGSRLRHVHLHDNKGGSADLHLPLGTGSVDFRRHLRALKKAGYDATITLEVFSPDKRHFEYSRDVLRQAWDEAQV